jgi:chlorite dismutase
MPDREKILGAPSLFVVIAAFKLSLAWWGGDASVRAGAAEELTEVLTRSNRQVAVDTYFSRGLKAYCDYFLRIHSQDLAEAQSYVDDYARTLIGRFSEVAEVFIGLTKPRQYITRQRSGRLNEQVDETQYDGDAPRFAIVIPVKKSAHWWSMSESERLSEIELHTKKSIPYLSRIKRALYHSTGLDEMDFITYFETADLRAFHELTIALAAIPENNFHTRWGQPILVGTLQSVPGTVALLCGNECGVRS